MNAYRKGPRWKLLFAPPRSGAENMARDMALLERARTSGECVFAVYTWSSPTLSLGRNQTARGLYDEGRITEAGIDVVRRPTGGRAILHDREVTYSVTGPDSYSSSLGDAYNRINKILVAALRGLGVPAGIAHPSRLPPRPDASPCFNEPVVGELVAAGKKLVGSAQFREKGAFLQHGSILIADDQARLEQLTLGGPMAMNVRPTAPATLTELLGLPPSVESVAEELFSRVRQREDPEAGKLDECEIRPAALALRSQFTDSEWTWRR